MGRYFTITTFSSLIYFFLLTSPVICLAGNTFTITGTITNINFLQRYIDKDTYLQIVKLPLSGFTTDEDERGRYYYQSNLAKIPFPENGVFTLNAENLEPGKYFISGQFFTNGSIYPILLKSEKHLATFNVKNNPKPHQQFELGEVFFQY